LTLQEETMYNKMHTWKCFKYCCNLCHRYTPINCRLQLLSIIQITTYENNREPNPLSTTLLHIFFNPPATNAHLPPTVPLLPSSNLVVPSIAEHAMKKLPRKNHKISTELQATRSYTCIVANTKPECKHPNKPLLYCGQDIL
jgi:hypothetical protein